MRAFVRKLTIRRSKRGSAPEEKAVFPSSQTPLAIPEFRLAEVKLPGNDITVPVAVTQPGSQFPQRVHPLQPIGYGPADLAKPIETNKWWAQLEVSGGQQSPCFAFPYTLWWSNTGPYGMNISHTEASQLVFGPGSPPPYYLNPIGISSLNIGAKEFTSAMSMGLDTPTQFTVNVTLSQGGGSIKFPFVEGMAWITGIYSGLTPLLPSVHAIISFQSSTMSGGSKYKISLNDGTTWLIYVFPNSGSYSLTQNGNSVVGSGHFNGYIQVAKIPIGSSTAESIYDAQAGTYVTTMSLFGATSGSTGTYGFQFGTAGKSSSAVLHFALPHHQASFVSDTQRTATGIYLRSTTMGVMQAYTATQWTMTETLPSNINWLTGTGYTQSQLSAIAKAAADDINYNVGTQTATCGSQYWAGKWFAKYAAICLVAHDVLHDSALSAAGIAKLKAAFATFQSNQQAVGLCYDTTWKGMTSAAGYTGGSGADYGNTWYNDHHFHYGYMVYAAAVLGHLDPSWLTPANVDYINCLVRDVANPSSQDPYFPVFRSFDWFVGHSWAAGLFIFGDGKNQESTSEDYNFSYGLRLWGIVTNNPNSQARGDLMCAVQRRYPDLATTINGRAINAYIYMTSDNNTQPSQFLPNCVSGIHWMNKMDHATFFGANEEMIEGIHMIPVTPISPFLRPAAFVQAEWSTRLNSIMSQVTSGWKGLCYANLAISDPKTAWNFFTIGFNSQWLDDGASLTWYLAFVAGLLQGGPTTSGPTTGAEPTPAPPSPPPTIPPPPNPTPVPPPAPPPAAIPAWSPTASYHVGSQVTYEGHTYQCLIAHQAQADWTPAVAPSLWRLIS